MCPILTSQKKRRHTSTRKRKSFVAPKANSIIRTTTGISIAISRVARGTLAIKISAMAKAPLLRSQPRQLRTRPRMASSGARRACNIAADDRRSRTRTFQKAHRTRQLAWLMLFLAGNSQVSRLSVSGYNALLTCRNGHVPLHEHPAYHTISAVQLKYPCHDRRIGGDHFSRPHDLVRQYSYAKTLV